MDTGDLYTLKGLVEASRGNRRTVQFWVEGGVVVAEPATNRAGSGVKRMFSRDEAIVVSILNAFSAMGASIGKLSAIAQTIRDQILKGEQRSIIEAAIVDRLKVYIVADEGRNLVLLYNPDEADTAEIMTRMDDYNYLAQIVFINPLLKGIDPEGS